MAAPHLAEQVGRVLDGRYRVIAPIGTGASAAVYLADDTVLRRRVAIKVLHAALAGDDLFLKRFQAEAHTAAGLSHPNIMRVLDWGDGEQGPFLVLEYLGGGSLRATFDQNPNLTPEQAIQIGIQAARALDYAHRRGLVHRDIKPANLLFDEEGRIAIADFGLARALAEAALTEPGGAMLGTARYASPEQVRGQSLNGKADVYSLGLVLYEAVTGIVPFTADTTIATLMGRLDSFVEIPESLGPLGPIIAAATHPDAHERISAADMVERLEAAVKELPSPEPVWLPGAIPIDSVSVDRVDPTMLPDVSEHGTRVSVQAKPLPANLVPKKRRLRMPRVKLPSLKAVFATLLMAILIAGAGFGAWTVYYKTGRELTVPTLTGLSADGARLAAKNAEIKLSFINENSETVPEGQTFDQTPVAGDKVHPREIVHVKLSTGPLPRNVPNVVGQQLGAVQAQFTDMGLQIETSNKYSETEPKDKILEQDPAGGTLPKGGTVKFVVSGGPAPRIIPSVQGMSQDDATKALTDQQLQVAVSQAFNDTVPAGQVAGTTPGAGASVARGSTVTLVISKGPELVAIPNVAGQSVASASNTLSAQGFNVNNVYGPPTGTVFATNPVSGSKVKKGSTIALYTR